jgi:hypothetical protein
VVPPTNVCACNVYDLYSAGLGVRWSNNNANLSATWAHALGSNPGASTIDGSNSDGRTSGQQLWLQAAIRF